MSCRLLCNLGSMYMQSHTSGHEQIVCTLSVRWELPCKVMKAFHTCSARHFYSANRGACGGRGCIMRVHIQSAFQRQMIIIYLAAIHLRLSQLVLLTHEKDMPKLIMRAYAADLAIHLRHYYMYLDKCYAACRRTTITVYLTVTELRLLKFVPLAY
jgi:hypothetical protein